MMTLKQLLLTFPNEDACRHFLQMRRWPKGVTCPRCGKKETVYAISKSWHWECSNPECRKGNAYRFSVIAGTVFENTKYPLRTWFEVLYTMLNSKKGVSSKQIERQVGCSYPTALYMCHRLRAGMADPEFKRLMGVVEVDETFVGGKEKNKHRSKRNKDGGTGGIGSGKTGVVGAISRKGNVVCRVIENLSSETLQGFVSEVVSDKVDLIATDQFAGYRGLSKKYTHGAVDHQSGEYVRGEIHTQSLDSFWALIKRGIIGTYHNVSRKYLPLYLNEFAFRHNNRNNEDIFGLAIAGC